MYEYESIGTIYKATCKINQKSYIGFCAAWPRRQKHHRTLANRGSPFAFHRAIRKHGWDNFEWEILYQSKDIQHCLNIVEPFLISEYNTLGKEGYNLVPGGEGRRGPKTIQHRAKLSEATKNNAAKMWALRREIHGPTGHSKPRKGNSSASLKAWVTRRERYGKSGNPQ